MSYVDVCNSSIDGSRSGNDGKYFYFFHVPKTGGRTVERHIYKRFGSDVIRPKKTKTFYAGSFARSKYVPVQHDEDVHIVGHYASWSLLGGREQKYFKACFWRHPADWFLSLYNFRHHRNTKRIRRPFAFEDFCKSMVRNPMTEHFLLYCGDVPVWACFFMSDLDKFELASTLAERFDHFKDISEVDDFLVVVGYENEETPADYNRLSPQQKTLATLDQTTRAEIERTCGVDYYLHKLAKSDDHLRVIDEARRALNPRFDPRDILRLIAVPYYRFKTWVLPFMAFPNAFRWVDSYLVGNKSRVPTAGDR